MEPSGVVWALSALGVLMTVITAYFAIFFMIIYAFSIIIMLVFKPIIRLIHG